jgi:hypothetical protein
MSSKQKRFQCVTLSLLDVFLNTMSRFRVQHHIYNFNETCSIVTHDKKPVQGRLYLYTSTELNEWNESNAFHFIKPCVLMVIKTDTYSLDKWKDYCDARLIPFVVHHNRESCDEQYYTIFSWLLSISHS